MNDENLRSLGDLPKAERSEIGRRGAAKTNQIKRDKKKLKKIIEAYLDTKDAKGLDKETLLVASIGEKAIGKSDVKAAEFIRDSLYDKPRQGQDIKADVQGAISINLNKKQK